MQHTVVRLSSSSKDFGRVFDDNSGKSFFFFLLLHEKDMLYGKGPKILIDYGEIIHSCSKACA